MYVDADYLHFVLQYLLYRSLGTCLVMADPPDDQKLNVLNDVWKIVVKLKHPRVRTRQILTDSLPKLKHTRVHTR